mgnify:CR=1 FL=1
MIRIIAVFDNVEVEKVLTIVLLNIQVFNLKACTFIKNSMMVSFLHERLFHQNVLTRVSSYWPMLIFSVTIGQN